MSGRTLGDVQNTYQAKLEKIIKDFFNKPSDDSKTKNKKVYRTEELETQINEIFNWK